MKNFKYAALAALLASSMLAGCNWNPFRKKPVVQPPLTNVATLDNTGAGADAVRPDVVTPPIVATNLTPTPPPPVAPPPAGNTYVIQKIDKGGFYAIARRELGDVRRWKEIQTLNPGVDPTKLRVGQTINIPPK